MSDAKELNKVISKVQKEPSGILYPSLDENTLNIQVYADGSFNSLPNNNSQGGHIVFLCDQYNQCVPLSWNSNKIKRVVRSALGAETLAMCDGCETAFSIRNMLIQAFPSKNIEIYVRLILPKHHVV